ncbi:glycogen/starch synthase [Sulfurimonas sp.]|uniref:glycogen synthase n=1 Tax=Sulfurimonas sp. TaxID=2022749 RepID=UPI0025E1DBC0|nr:glycogen/starch synthase [Sulfurimonas sp.]
MNKLKILIAASEVVPFAKTGGLADVVGALPKALHSLGHDVRVVMPRYYVVDIKKYKLKPLVGALGVPMGIMGEIWALVYEGVLPDSAVPVYFIEYEDFFGRSGLYDDGVNGYDDNDNRFIFFSRAVMQLAKKLEFHPDVIHANDWHTATIPMLLNTIYAFDSNFAYTGSLLSIHNLQHQGKFYKGVMDVMGIGWNHFYEMQEHDSVNLLKGGIVHADAVSTVSQKYAQEIRSNEFGWGLNGLIDSYSYKLHGILNGVDYDEWNPSLDSFIAKKFDTKNMSPKAICKADIQASFNLPQRGDVPLIGFVGRLVEQKGIHLLASAIYKILEMDIQIVMLGAGEKWAEHFFGEIAFKYPEKFSCYIGYRNDLAHKIEAGSDLFLMPSLFEPCGLNQIYSLRYGTLPIVRATGGLDDTIESYHNDSKHGNGFKFTDATPEALFNTIGWAVYTYYNDKVGFDNLRKNAMSARFDWIAAAKEYEALYYKIAKGRKGHV